jgi:hypothetical protein
MTQMIRLHWAIGNGTPTNLARSPLCAGRIYQGPARNRRAICEADGFDAADSLMSFGDLAMDIGRPQRAPWPETLAAGFSDRANLRRTARRKRRPDSRYETRET